MPLITPTLITSTLLSLMWMTITTMLKKDLNQTKMKNILAIPLMMSLVPLMMLLNNNTEFLMSTKPLIPLPTMNINISLTLDTYSLTFIPIALFVTWSIVEFSTWYMATDPNINKFIKYLLIFLIAMLIIISSNNLFQFFIGWEGEGIMSFLLIGWWSSRSDANTAALQAIIYNRIGNIGLIMTTSWTLTNTSINIQELFMEHKTMNILPLLGLVAAATGKSAQFGLHPWLPAAMEGPTPVSALLHSSTMVVAGIFLLIRLHPVLQNNQQILSICLLLGATTTMFAAASATTQHDIKKIIALSTTSQLGLMMTMIGLNKPTLAFLHMAMHSFFKALLFLCAGSIIHNTDNEQDTRKMGGLNKTMPATTSSMTVASLALMGMPFISGFYSKDTIIETIMNSNINTWALIMTLTATLLSAVYSMQIMILSQTSTPRTKQNPHKETKPTMIPILRLTLASILLGTTTKLSTLQTTTTTTMPITIKLAALIITLTGVMLSIDLSMLAMHQKPKKVNTIQPFLNQLAFFNILHRALPMKMLKFGQHTSTELVDMWMLENYGPTGLANSTKTLIYTSTQQKNMIKNYLTTFMITTILATLILP
uniref:NADH-ubiquinone oxidoreductase chain 5 n=1 Tax=Tropidophis haetianus TaxID=51980 RepID=C1JZA1_TROHA|nr:NADH dehydrogenase subunit 5 [Tropidophis haetianus]ACO58444.1 NADH dehydrogenase subunit 5 [Tropidophis haetianus]